MRDVHVVLSAEDKRHFKCSASLILPNGPLRQVLFYPYVIHRDEGTCHNLIAS